MAEWRVPGFTQLGELGKGGQGLALLVKEDVSGRTAVLKYLFGGATPAAREAFRRESTILKGVSSPYVARWYGHYEDPEGSAILMEAVPGRSLKAVLDESGPLAPEVALVVLKGSLLGLAAAHERGLVHRDYKPGNVIVRDDGGSKLIDFGVACLRGEASRSGTPAYMAPEQWSSRAATPATDVYAATCVFFECVTGHRPYGGNEMPALQRGHLLDAIPAEAVPEPLRPLVLAGLAKQEDERPPSATAFVEQLETIAVAAYGDDWETRGLTGLAVAAVAVAALLPAAALTAGGGTTATGVAAGGTATGSTSSGSGVMSTVGGKVALAVGGLTAAGAVATAGVLVLSSNHHPAPTASPKAAALVAAVTPFQAPADTWLKGSNVTVSGGDPAIRAKINAALRVPYDQEVASERRQMKSARAACTQSLPGITARITPTISLSRPSLISVSYKLNLTACASDSGDGTSSITIDLATGRVLTAKDFFPPSVLTSDGVKPLQARMTLLGAQQASNVLCSASMFRPPENFLAMLTAADRVAAHWWGQDVVFTSTGIEVWFGPSHLCGEVRWTAPYSAIRSFLQPSFAARL